MDFVAKLISERPMITCLVINLVLTSVWLLKFQEKLKLKWYFAPILTAIMIAIGHLLARFWALLEVGFDFSQAASMRVFGPILILPILTYFVSRLMKIDASLALDIMAVSTIIGVFSVRINCLISGCCKGVLITTTGTARWPLVEMEMLLYIVLCIYFWNKIYKRQTKGMAYPIFMLVYGIFRFVIEWVREEYTGELWIFHMAHIWSLLAIVGSAVAIYLIKKHNKNGAKHRSPTDAKSGKKQKGGK